MHACLHVCMHVRMHVWVGYMDVGDVNVCMHTQWCASRICINARMYAHECVQWLMCKNIWVHVKVCVVWADANHTMQTMVIWNVTKVWSIRMCCYDAYMSTSSNVCQQVPIAIGGPGLPSNMQFRSDLPKAGLANVTATFMNLMGFEAPADYEPTLIESV